MENQQTISISKAQYQELLGYKEELAQAKKEAQKLNSKLEYKEFIIAELKRLIYGSKRERFVPENNPNQKSLFNLKDFELRKTLPKKETITYTREKPEKSKKKVPLRAEIPAHLPRVKNVVEPDFIPEGAVKIGESVTEILNYKPGKIEVEQIVRPKYVVRSSDKENKVETPIIIADYVGSPIPRSNAGASFIAHILISKFMDHLPFYRQHQILKRQGILLAQSTMNGWFSNTVDNLLVYLHDVARKELLKDDYLMVDESPIPVLTKDKAGSTHRGYLWVYYSPGKKLVIFDYSKSRSRDGPNRMLSNFSGYLQTDGYAAYNNLSNKQHITQLACMAHARRCFEKALDNDPERAEYALRGFQKLYEIERIARDGDMDHRAIKALREQKAVPVLEQMKEWMDKQVTQVPPKNAIGQAFHYTLRLWPRLVRYVKDGRFYIDNNLVENSIRPVALGRKNYLFAGSHQAAQRAAIMYSLLAICKINDVEPYQWLKSTLERLPNCKASKLHTLLPTYKKDK